MLKVKTIKQNISFDASPEELYYLFMDPYKHAAFTGSDVIISNEINGKFNIFNGYCKGYNIELAVAQKIVQAWNFAENGWPENHYSICKFSFEPNGNKTKLKFEQTGIPEHKVDQLKKGWKEYYWIPMKAYLKINTD
ncbi:MAG: SRPBCC domain-containing protein [Saprospiraceae bacterium]|nr:SRPBCC domain-containing protein [Saprospiraceae bacterium]